MKKSIEDIAKADGRYNIRALKFIYDSLGMTIQDIRDQAGEEEHRHISGQELAQGVAKIAKQRWGYLAKMVLNQWGIHRTRDIGEIVYLMIENNWMTRQENDSIDDFNDVYDFETIFEKQFRFENNN